MNRKQIFEVADINVSVSDDSQFLSPLSEIGKPVISSEVAEFLENSAKEYAPPQALRLTISSKCIDEDEKPKYCQAIRNHFSLKLSDTKREIKRKSVLSLVFFVVGIIALAAMLFLRAKNIGDVWTECVDIFAWVFLWEAVDQFFIERNNLILRGKRLKNFVEMEIIYM